MKHIDLGLASRSYTATNGITYGPVRLAVPWGSAACPVAPRVYRVSHGRTAAPEALRDVVGEPGLRLAELDTGIWDRMDIRVLPERLRQAVSRELGSLPWESKVVALPGGLPLGWVVELPLRTRTRGMVSRLIVKHGEGGLDRSLLIEDIMAMYHVGTTTMLDLLCVLESAELDIGPIGASESDVYSSVPEARATPEQRRIRRLAAWALAETDAVTLGDAFTLLAARQAGPSEWSELAETCLGDIAKRSPHPYRLIESWVARLPERERRIFMLRLATIEQRPTLRDLGGRLGITGERVRQIAKELYGELLSYLETWAGTPIRWRIETIRLAFGVAIPKDRTAHLLESPIGCRDYSSLLLEIAGPYVSLDGWLVLRSSLGLEPTLSIIGLGDQFGRIDRKRATALLDRWGLDQSLHSEWLTRDGRIRLIDDQLIRWKGPLADKLAFALDKEGTPSTPEALLGSLGLGLKHTLRQECSVCRPSVYPRESYTLCVGDLGAPRIRRCCFLDPEPASAGGADAGGGCGRAAARRFRCQESHCALVL